MDNNNELFEQIKMDVFAGLGIKLSNQDPIFAMVMANQAAMRTFSAPIVEAIESIPLVLESSLNIIAGAVEEAERSAGQLTTETKAVLAALSKVELESAHRRIKDAVELSVDSAVTGSVQRLKSEVVKLETDLRSLGAHTKSKRTFFANLLLSSAVLVLLGVFSTAAYVLYGVGIDNRDAADYWRSKYSDQQQIVGTLPPTYKKLFVEQRKPN
ncbi:hypothetical protein K1567_27355 [Pseudomonas sp. S5F11]|jgi:nitrogen fixation/metabolism regulation signal transduction histidine kinase|uniref:hypothetical protein n=1 Tax=Pseudomonas sp. S5F11 TaxID=2866385 RepID=UPI001C7E06F8|nr:hypothetical protein [Pseudomonas sp. S5F11]MBX4139532.1 hypothetical protein [Pseudomonas sp. S5F11]MBX4139608.1 hypothetical protein [Pseudomonas sp. S5F11]